MSKNIIERQLLQRLMDLIKVAIIVSFFMIIGFPVDAYANNSRDVTYQYDYEFRFPPEYEDLFTDDFVFDIDEKNDIIWYNGIPSDYSKDELYLPAGPINVEVGYHYESVQNNEGEWEDKYTYYYRPFTVRTKGFSSGGVKKITIGKGVKLGSNPTFTLAADSEITIDNADWSDVTDVKEMFCGVFDDGGKVNIKSMNLKNCASLKEMFRFDVTGVNISGEIDESVTDAKEIVTDSYGGYVREKALKSISFNAVNNIKNMDSMLQSCFNLETASINANKVESMKNMFYGCSGLTSIDLSPLDTSNVENMNGMFYGCSGLTSIDLSPLDTSKVKDMGYMFGDCNSLSSLDLTPLNTSNVENMNGMFYGCSGLTSIDLTPLNTSNVEDMDGMFRGCSGFTSLDLSPLDTSKVIDMGDMFFGCSGLTSLDLSPLDTSNVVFISRMFSGCSGLTNISLSPLDMSYVGSLKDMFSGCSGLKSIDLRMKNMPEDFCDMNGMFSGCSGLTSINLEPLKGMTGGDMGSMFSDCSSLASIDLSPLKGFKVRGDSSERYSGIEKMFYGCTSLKSVDLSPLGRAGSMLYIFSGCSSLESVDFSSMNLYCEGSKDAFKDCNNLKKVIMPSSGCGIEYGDREGVFPHEMFTVDGVGYYYISRAPADAVLRSNVNDFTEEERKGSTSSSGKDNTSSSGKDNTSSSGKDNSSSSERKDSSSSSGKDNSSSSSDKVLPDKVPLASDTDFYASSKDNFAPVATSGKITKLTLDFTKVDLSSVDPGKLNMTAIKGSKFTVGDIKTATGQGVKVKVNKKKSVATVTAKKSGQADFETSDGKKYTVRFTVETPKAQKGAKKIGIDQTATKILTIRDMFGTDIDGGKLSIVKEKVSGQAVVDSTNNTLTVTPKEKDTIKILYQVLNKKYKLTIKVK